MLTIGAHLSISLGYAKAAEQAVSIGANSFQFFTRNPRGGSARAFDEADVNNLSRIISENEFGELLAHAPYTINMASDDERVRTGAEELLAGDLSLMNKLPCRLYNVHPGSRKTAGVEEGVKRVADIINKVLKPEHDCFFLLETMSGKGSELGVTFEEIQMIIERIDLKDKIGVCMDTCHLFSAGYDIVNDIDGVMTSFDKIIGISKLKAVHINDSMNPFNSRKDRHEKLGKGLIGIDAIVNFINHPAICSLPMLLETPNDIKGYEEEISVIKSLYRH